MLFSANINGFFDKKLTKSRKLRHSVINFALGLTTKLYKNFTIKGIAILSLIVYDIYITKKSAHAPL